MTYREFLNNVQDMFQSTFDLEINNIREGLYYGNYDNPYKLNVVDNPDIKSENDVDKTIQSFWEEFIDEQWDSILEMSTDISDGQSISKDGLKSESPGVNYESIILDVNLLKRRIKEFIDAYEDVLEPLKDSSFDYEDINSVISREQHDINESWLDWINEGEGNKYQKEFMKTITPINMGNWIMNGEY